MSIVGIDPGDVSSAIVVLDNKQIVHAIQQTNDEVLSWMKSVEKRGLNLSIEGVQSFGMVVGRQVFETCVWVGRFTQCWVDHDGMPPRIVYRTDIKRHFCNAVVAKDKNIRRVLLDRFGGDNAKGSKRAPGPLYGIGTHSWSALAVALYTYECVLRSPSN